MSDERLLQLCRDFADAVRSGLAIGDAFGPMSKAPRSGGAIGRAAESAAAGMPLHEALAAERAFPPVFVSLVRAGEAGGKLEEFLDRFAEAVEAKIEFRRQVMRLLLYPVFTVVLAASLFFLFSLKAVPMIMGPVREGGINLPSEAFWMTDFAERVAQQWRSILLWGTAAVIALVWLARSMLGRSIWSIAGHVVPGIRFATHESRLDLFASTIGLLVRSGLPLGTMTEILSQLFEDDPILRWRLSRAADLIAQGRSISESLGGAMPADDRRSVELAEKTGRLDEVLLRLGKEHRARQTHRLKTIATAFKIGSTVMLAFFALAVIWTLVEPIRFMLGGVGPEQTVQLSAPVPDSKPVPLVHVPAPSVIAPGGAIKSSPMPYITPVNTKKTSPGKPRNSKPALKTQKKKLQLKRVGSSQDIQPTNIPSLSH